MARGHLLLATVIVSACAGTSAVSLPTGLVGREVAEGDVVEVWVCHVPVASSAPIFGGLPLRVPLDPQTIVDRIGSGLTDYFAEVSSRRYALEVRAGGEVSIGVSDGHERCVDDALDGSSDVATAVLVVADAEHAADQPGGFGDAGVPCERPCPASTSRRWAYVGASDFAARWGTSPPLDLVQHELGHVIGWSHSAVSPHGGYLSALDVMSDSAAPRVVDAARRDAPGPIGIHRLRVGWLDAEHVVVSRPPRTVELVAVLGLSSPSAAGVELFVVPVDTRTLITVEVLAARRLWGHLPADGVAVHVVRLGADGSPTSIDPVTPSGRAPYVDLLGAGASLRVLGVDVTVLEVVDGVWTVRVA